MLTFEKANKKIARIEGGKYDNELLYLYNPDYKCCSQCSDSCSSKKKCCDRCMKRKKGGCGSCIGGKLRTRDTFESMTIDDGKIVPLPNDDENDADHYFISGQTGAGKSSMIGDIIREMPKEDKKKEVFVFSTFDEDKALDHLKPSRILIDDDIIDDPIQKEELKDSIVIFDDIDTLNPTKLSKACNELRDDLLQNGRKMGIKVFTTSHQIMNYKKTRDSLNSTQKIIIFPQATSPHHIKRFLETYMGLNKKQVQYIMKIPTRWILFSTNFPRYMVWEKGCMILNKVSDPSIRELHKYDSDSESDFDDEKSLAVIKQLLKKQNIEPLKKTKSLSLNKSKRSKKVKKIKKDII